MDEFRLLGQVELRRDGVRVELGGPKQRALLAALLLRAGRVVPLDRLVDDLWPDHPPARAAATVQVFVSNLRRALEPDRPRGAAASVLVTAAPGYRLVVDPARVDAVRFAGLAADGRAARDDDPERAVELLGAAADLWHGPALADLSEPFARSEATRLEELRLGAEEDRADAELALGRHATVVAELEQRVGRHPMRERSRAQLMRALYRCDRQADALRVYREGSRLLREELGVEPGAPLRELELAVLRQDPELDWEPPAPVVLPAAPAAQPAPEPAASAEESGRVLVVDDSGVNRRLLAAAVTGLGHEVQVADNGRRAVDLLRAGDFDVVLLDLMMPVLDGFATLAELKADPELDHLPVIMVSAVPELSSVVRCIELGATDYLPKPFSADVLRARLRASLAAKRLRDAERDQLRHLEIVVAEREAALQAEIAALRAEVDHARGGARGGGPA
ncbi:BTAD domain-containing putative transcriptional regulator [Spongisporangium articulatum]|uniref:BTAD domain-containing putative transcriptional regulator n=1 Tax=Spongisporangium articulatum TaxID=3362603 RepID=A0ABW8AH29_9ACTN